MRRPLAVWLGDVFIANFIAKIAPFIPNMYTKIRTSARKINNRKVRNTPNLPKKTQKTSRKETFRLVFFW